MVLFGYAAFIIAARVLITQTISLKEGLQHYSIFCAMFLFAGTMNIML